MKIAICGSFAFAKEMIEIKNKLEKLGHKVIIQEDIGDFITGKRTNENKWQKLRLDPLTSYFKEIQNSEAIIVVNITKNRIENYIGGNSLIEMAFAHVLKKRIFLLNSVPKMSYTDEIEIMKPIVLNGNLTKIK